MEQRSTLKNVVHCLFEPFFLSNWLILIDKVRALSIKRSIPSYKRVLLEAALYYALLSPVVAMPLYNRIILQPSMSGNYDTSAIAGIKKEDVLFPGKNGKLHGWYFANPIGKKVVLISHGNAGNISSRTALINLLLQTGASVFIYDYSGYGYSPGVPSVEQCCADADSAYDYLARAKGFNASSIVLYGESIGTGITCNLARKRQCSAVILQSGYKSLPSLAKEKMILFNVYPDIAFGGNQLDNLAFVKDKHPPLLLIHGKNDRVISPVNSEVLFQEASAPKGIVQLNDAEHNDCCLHASYEMLVAINALVE